MLMGGDTWYRSAQRGTPGSWSTASGRNGLQNLVLVQPGGLPIWNGLAICIVSLPN